MGKTIRWWNNPRIKKLSAKIKQFAQNWNINPFYARHERKEIRVELHRESRHANRIRIDRGMDIEPERRTCGWETH